MQRLLPPATKRPPSPNPRSGIVASFGGLLMLLTGDQRHLLRIALDQKVYALVRKQR